MLSARDGSQVLVFAIAYVLPEKQPIRFLYSQRIRRMNTIECLFPKYQQECRILTNMVLRAYIVSGDCCVRGLNPGAFMRDIADGSMIAIQPDES
jgi:hypothetical protein